MRNLPYTIESESASAQCPAIAGLLVHVLIKCSLELKNMVQKSKAPRVFRPWLQMFCISSHLSVSLNIFLFNVFCFY